MKKYFYALCMATALGTVGCSDDEVINSGDVIDPSLKTSISFSASDEAGGGTSTKALTKADDAGFTAETQIAARFVSKEGSTTNVRFTRTLLQAKQAETGQPYSKVDFSGEAYKRYWDDAFGRAARISVYAIAVPGKTGVTNNGKSLEKQLDDSGTKVNDVSNPNWMTAGTENNTMSWTVSVANQSKDLIENEDLCYSNNIKADGKYGRYVWNKTDGKYPDFKYEANPTNPYPNFSDGELSFQLDDDSKTAGPGHFDKGHMIFKHALTRVTIKLYAGDGFNMDQTTNNPFAFTNAHGTPNVTLYKMPTSGTLDIKTGEWSNPSNSDIQGICQDDDSRNSITNANKSDNPAYTLRAQMLPGYTINATDASNYVMSFEIDENVYYVSHAQINKALRDGGLTGTGNITMEQGTHYVLSITVNKTAISNVTATLVDWKEVTSNRFNAENAYIKLNSFKPEGDATACKKFDIYRIENLNKSVTYPGHIVFDGVLQYKLGYANADGGGHTPHKLSTEDGTITDNGDGSWKTTWFFESNKTFYHFRTVWPGTTIYPDHDKGDYFKMFSGPVYTTGTTISTGIDDDNNHDYHWGAVFKEGTTNLKYVPDNGFESQLIGPIGPTKDAINIVEQHMMSKINVVLLTPVDGSGNYLPQSVTLYDGTKTGAGERVVSEVKLINFWGSAKVLMGTGQIIAPLDDEPSRHTSLVTAPTYSQEYTLGATGNYCKQKDYTFEGDPLKYYKTKEYTYCVVPQPLVDETKTNKVGITIQTPDDNLYYVMEDLSKITVQKVEGSSVKQDHAENGTIERWYPGYSYTYYFVLTKTGIKAITCTIVDWKKVEGKKQDVTLES